MPAKQRCYRIFTCPKTCCIVFAMFLLTIAGCGKAGPPVPRDAPGTLYWSRATAIPVAADCIGFAGSLEGDLLRLDSVVIELEAIGDDANCATCPFKATLRRSYSATTLGMHPENPGFTQTICVDDTSETYRWRLVAQSTYRATPYAVSPIKKLTLPQ